jgi:hypothetical protein
MASYAVTRMRSVGAFYATKLKAAGIRSSEKLLERAGPLKGRKQLAQQTGIPESDILRWTNLADLMRVRGVAADYSELLAAAGVDTVKELKRRNAPNLTARLAAVNAERNLVDFLPGETRVARWIEEAKTLEPKITY